MTVMYKFAELIGAHAEEFALLDTLDMGKPINDMLNIDVPVTQATIQYFAECIDKVEGAVTATASDAFHYISREPLGSSAASCRGTTR
jgi:gamma-glutamyl-gamma-aminobutyraldehyde dehydrogenase